MAKVTITIEDTEDGKAVSVFSRFEPAVAAGTESVHGAQAVAMRIIESLSELVAENGGEIETE